MRLTAAAARAVLAREAEPPSVELISRAAARGAVVRHGKAEGFATVEGLEFPELASPGDVLTYRLGTIQTDELAARLLVLGLVFWKTGSWRMGPLYLEPTGKEGGWRFLGPDGDCIPKERVRVLGMAVGMAFDRIGREARRVSCDSDGLRFLLQGDQDTPRSVAKGFGRFAK